MNQGASLLSQLPHCPAPQLLVSNWCLQLHTLLVRVHIKAMVSSAGLHIALVQCNQTSYMSLPTTKLCKPVNYVSDDMCHETCPICSSETWCVLLLLCATEPASTCLCQANRPASDTSPTANTPLLAGDVGSSLHPCLPNPSGHHTLQFSILELLRSCKLLRRQRLTTQPALPQTDWWRTCNWFF